MDEHPAPMMTESEANLRAAVALLVGGVGGYVLNAIVGLVA